eukprot:759841-Amphidinium_carterae.1
MSSMDESTETNRLDALEDRVDRLRAQVLFTLQQTVQQDRQRCGNQIVLLNWRKCDGCSLSATPAQIRAGIERRNGIISTLLSSALPQLGDAWRASHQTRGDRLSPVTVVTLQFRPQVFEVLAHVKAHNKPSDGDHEIKIRPQVTLYDRMVAAPCKAAMALVSDSHPHLKQEFVVKWKDGVANLRSGEPFCVWRVNPARGILTLDVHEAYYRLVKDGIRQKVLHMLYPGATKGSGKAKTPQYVERSFDDVDSEYLAEQLSGLQLADLPFHVEVYALSTNSRKRTPQQPQHERHDIGTPRRERDIFAASPSTLAAMAEL